MAVVQSNLSSSPISNSEFEDQDVKDEFYDALGSESSSSEEDDGSDAETENKVFPLFFYLENDECWTFSYCDIFTYWILWPG